LRLYRLAAPGRFAAPKTNLTLRKKQKGEHKNRFTQTLVRPGRTKKIHPCHTWHDRFFRAREKLWIFKDLFQQGFDLGVQWFRPCLCRDTA
jgi:hypothetical protein